METDGNLYVSETYINATKGHIFGDSGPEPYETFTANRGELFRELQKEYGRCISRMYVDTADGVKAIGWVFQGRQKYEDTGEPYLREVWVTVHTAPDTVARTPHYAEMAV